MILDAPGKFVVQNLDTSDYRMIESDFANLTVGGLNEFTIRRNAATIFKTLNAGLEAGNRWYSPVKYITTINPSSFDDLTLIHRKFLTDITGSLTNLNTTNKTNLVAAINETLASAGGSTNLEFKEVTAANYTVIDSDNNKILFFNQDCTVTLPNGVANGVQVILRNDSATATITINAAGTLFSESGNTITGQYSHGSVYKQNATEWVGLFSSTTTGGGSSLTTEEVQDIIGATFIDGNNTTVDYDDAANTIQINVPPTPDLSTYLVKGSNSAQNGAFQSFEEASISNYNSYALVIFGDADGATTVNGTDTGLLIGKNNFRSSTQSLTQVFGSQLFSYNFATSLLNPVIGRIATEFATSGLYLERANNRANSTPISILKFELVSGDIDPSLDAIVLTDNRTSDKYSIQLLGYGETDISTAGSVDYSSIPFNGLVPRKLVEDLIAASSGGGGTTLHSGLTLDDGTNPHNTDKSDVGLGNVDNTSDVNKPVSTAQETALNSKVSIATDQTITGNKIFTPNTQFTVRSSSNLVNSNIRRGFFSITSQDSIELHQFDQEGLGAVYRLRSASAASGGVWPPASLSNYGGIYVEDGTLKYVDPSGVRSNLSGNLSKSEYAFLDTNSNTVQFDRARKYGFPTPRTGSILFNFTNAIEGQTQYMSHNSNTKPTMPSNVNLLSGKYITGVVNKIAFIPIKISSSPDVWQVDVTVSQQTTW